MGRRGARLGLELLGARCRYRRRRALKAERERGRRRAPNYRIRPLLRAIRRLPTGVGVRRRGCGFRRGIRRLGTGEGRGEAPDHAPPNVRSAYVMSRRRLAWRRAKFRARGGGGWVGVYLCVWVGGGRGAARLRKGRRRFRFRQRWLAAASRFQANGVYFGWRLKTAGASPTVRYFNRDDPRRQNRATDRPAKVGVLKKSPISPRADAAYGAEKARRSSDIARPEPRPHQPSRPICATVGR